MTDLVFAKFPKKDKNLDDGTGFIASTDKDLVLNWNPGNEPDENDDDLSSTKHEISDNLSIINEEIFNILISYYDFIPILMGFVGIFPRIIIDNEVRTIFEEQGSLIAEDETYICYSASSTKIREINKSGKKIESLRKISPILSKFYILGLISQYDSFIYRISKIIIEKKPSIVFNKETSVSYSELEKHDTVSDIRNIIVEKELEKVLRSSHKEQIDWFSNNLGVKLEPEAGLMSSFLELCERRNLFAHTGGIVNQQYIDKCKKIGYETGKISAGELISADIKYFLNSVDTVIEMAFQLVSTIWNILEPDSSSDISKSLINITYSLIEEEKYELAIRLIKFITKNKSFKMDASIRMTHTINCANAMKLSKIGGHEELVNAVDWSAASNLFVLCKDAVLDDVDSVCTRIENAVKSKEIQEEQIREWPVFKGMIENKKFQEKFEEIFGQPILKTSVVNKVSLSKTKIKSTTGES